MVRAIVVSKRTPTSVMRKYICCFGVFNRVVHPAYIEMVKSAIGSLQDQRGSSKHAIQKYINSTYGITEDKKMFAHLRTALNKGVSSGVLKRMSGIGASGSFKINKDKVDEPKKKAAVAPKKTDVAAKKKSGAAGTKKAATGTASKKQSQAVVKKMTKNAAAVKLAGTPKAAPKKSRAGIVKTTNDVNKPAEIKKAAGSKSRPTK